jgi:hypothetical protein
LGISLDLRLRHRLRRGRELASPALPPDVPMDTINRFILAG